MELDTDEKRATVKDTHLDSTNLLEENLRFLGQALKMNFELGPKQVCTQILDDKNALCGAKVIKTFYYFLLIKTYLIKFLDVEKHGPLHSTSATK